MSGAVSDDVQARHIRVAIEAFAQGRARGEDFLTVEEPLEIRVASGDEGSRSEHSLSVTMRTPGDDAELVLGFLLGEAVIRSPSDVEAIAPCGEPSLDKGLINVIRVELAAGTRFEPEQLSRHTLTTSSCGVCGKAALDAVRVAIVRPEPSPLPVSADVLKTLPANLAKRQVEFTRTGGLHACATFDATGRIERVREDVGRHNALDKLIGSYFLEGAGLLERRGLMLSGRASFELLQKAALAGFPLVAAIGPPSSLALELAEAHGITLVGFLRSDRFNVYSGADTISD